MIIGTSFSENFRLFKTILQNLGGRGVPKNGQH